MKSTNSRAPILLVISLMIVCTLWLAGKTVAQEVRYPEKQIEIIVGMAPGGVIDVGTRIVAEELGKELKVPVVVVNKPGAGTLTGNLFVLKAKPDGYTLLGNMNSSATSGAAMEKTPSYDPVNDFSPIGFFGILTSIMSVNRSSKFTSFDSLVKFARENPGKLNCATAGVGTTSHFTLEYLRSQGVSFTMVPTKGTSDAITELLGNHVDLTSTGIVGVVPHLKSGQLRALVATKQLKEFPEVPTFDKVGFPGMSSLENWLGLFASANLPKPVFNRLSVAYEKVAHSPSVAQLMEAQGLVPAYMGPEEAKKQLADQYRIIKEIATAAGLVK
jgi:tripartite-type tricarboxylate transporter receptor subunit TctC